MVNKVADSAAKIRDEYPVDESSEKLSKSRNAKHVNMMQVEIEIKMLSARSELLGLLREANKINASSGDKKQRKQK